MMTGAWRAPASAALLFWAAAAGAQTPPRADHGMGMVAHQSSPEAVMIPHAQIGYRPVILVREGTPVAIAVTEDFAARTRPLKRGDRVRLEVAEPVRSESAILVPRSGPAGGEPRFDIGPRVQGGGGIVLLPAGRPVTAEVTEAAGASIAIRLVSVYVDGHDVPLRGTARGRLRPGTRIEGALADHIVPAQPLMPVTAPLFAQAQVLAPPRAVSVAIPARMPPPDPKIVAPARPKAPLVALIAAADYPEAALRAGEQGEATVILEVAPNGRVVTCVVTHPTGFAALDAASCRLLHARARFTPATNSQGSAVASWVEHKVRWTLPGRR